MRNEIWAKIIKKAENARNLSYVYGPQYANKCPKSGTVIEATMYGTEVRCPASMFDIP